MTYEEVLAHRKPTSARDPSEYFHYEVEAILREILRAENKDKPQEGTPYYEHMDFIAEYEKREGITPCLSVYSKG